MSTPDPAIDLVIPGLLHLPTHDIDLARLQQVAPSLYRLLRCANREATPARDFDQILLDLLGLEQAALPYALASRQPGEQSSAGSAVLTAPVFLKADINNAIVFPVHADDDEINKIINDLNDYFKVDFTLELITENRWLMHLRQCGPVIDVPHYLNALGKKVTHYLEQARSNLDWFRLFNEIQMFLYQHPLNQQRLQQGQVMINSLWCWGGDEAREPSRRYDGWYSDEPELQNLGVLYAKQRGGLNALLQRKQQDSSLAIDLRLLQSLKSGREDDLVELLQQIEHSYLADLLDQTTNGIRLHTGAGINFYYHARHGWRFWRSLSWSFPLQ